MFKCHVWLPEGFSIFVMRNCHWFFGQMHVTQHHPKLRSIWKTFRSGISPKNPLPSANDVKQIWRGYPLNTYTHTHTYIYIYMDIYTYVYVYGHILFLDVFGIYPLLILHLNGSNGPAGLHLAELCLPGSIFWLWVTKGVPMDWRIVCSLKGKSTTSEFLSFRWPREGRIFCGEPDWPPTWCGESDGRSQMRVPTPPS